MLSVKKVVLILVSCGIFISLIMGAKYLLDVQNYKKRIKEMKIENVDLLKISDGRYLGSFDTQFIKVKLIVEVKEHKISGIQLLQHINGTGKPAEAILGKVINAQSLNVDTITGATNSSKVILKSIELALKGEKQF